MKGRFRRVQYVVSVNIHEISGLFFLSRFFLTGTAMRGLRRCGHFELCLRLGVDLKSGGWMCYVYRSSSEEPVSGVLLTIKL